MASESQAQWRGLLEHEQRRSPLAQDGSPRRVSILPCSPARLFLQRFSLSFGNSLLSLDVVPAVFILIYQFAAGRLVIVYDRLLWFLALGFAATCSLLLNFQEHDAALLLANSLSCIFCLR